MAGPSYILQIPEPCRQDWHQMQPDGKGRYCAHCSKVVTDFAKLSDEQIIELLKTQNGKLCGRLNLSQLNRTLVGQQRVPYIQKRIKEVFAALLLLLTTRQVNAYDNHTVPHKAITTIQPVKRNNAALIADDTTLLYTIKGRVIDSVTNLPLPGTIVDNLNHRGEITDDSGRFEIVARAGDILHVSMLGYTLKQFTANCEKKDVVIVLSPNDKFTEEVQLVGGISLRPSLWYRIKYFFRIRLKHKQAE